MTAVFSKTMMGGVQYHCVLHQQITEVETAEVVHVWSANLIMCS